MSMVVDRRKAILFVIAALLRLILFHGFPSLPELLSQRVELSTPVTGFKRLREGVFLYSHNVSPYDGGVFHQAPLLLPLFTFIFSWQSTLITNLVYVALDLVLADCLMRIADSGESRESRLYRSPRRGIKWDGYAIGAAYLFSPYSCASCLSRSTALITNCAITYATYKAVAGKAVTSVLFMALASYLSFSPVLLLPPLIILSFDRTLGAGKGQPSMVRFSSQHCGVFFISIACFLFESFLICGNSWDFIGSTYGVHLQLPDLTPNVGLWWYFFIEMFDSFRDFFLGVFWLHLGGYTSGLCIRLRSQPLFVITTMLGLCAIFKPYPSISDVSLYFAFLPLYRHLFPLMRYSFLATATILYTTLLGPAFFHLWIGAGSGNANFFYAITLVWSLGLSFIVGDSLYAVLRDEWEVERPEMVGKDVRRI